MRLLLDLHISGEKVGEPLRALGHDVRAGDSDPDLRGVGDPLVLAMAYREDRILVTSNVKDFVRIIRE